VEDADINVLHDPPPACRSSLEAFWGALRRVPRAANLLLAQLGPVASEARTSALPAQSCRKPAYLFRATGTAGFSASAPADGKVERSHRVDDQEFYRLLDDGRITDDIHLFTRSCGSD
jgi:hypothetical protein